MTKARSTPSSPRATNRPPLLPCTLPYAALLALTVTMIASSAHATTTPTTPELPAVQEAIAGLAVPFEQNTGQFDPEVAYLAKTFAGAVFVTRDGRLVYSLPGKAIETAADDGAKEARPARRPRPAERGPGWALEERLLDARPLAPQGTVPAVTHVTRFTPKGTFQAETWQGVRLGEAWAGIEVELAARGRNFEKLFHVAPGADPEKIRVGLRGAEGVHIATDGRLIVGTGNGEIAYTAPVAWQEIEGERRPVAVHYALLEPDVEAEGSIYGFALGEYDRHRPLTIDPLIQSTYLGGRSPEKIYTLALAANGDVLVGGQAYSGLPGTAGGAQPNWGFYADGFVARLSGNLRTLIQSTYLGGNGDDIVYALALADNGDVLVGGNTDSSNLPGTADAAQSSNRGGRDGFVARLAGDLRTLHQSTYLGGSHEEEIRGLALAANGDVLVGGVTASSDLPGTAGGVQPGYGGGETDGFAARLSSNLRTLIRSTYLGGSWEDEIRALARADNGDFLVGGRTWSTNLPGVVGGAQPSNHGNTDGFVARLAGDLRTLIQCTYLGGSTHDSVRALALATNGDVLVGGAAGSLDFPGTAGGAQPSHSGYLYDGFVARLSSNLRMLRQSTYLGGNSYDDISALNVATNGDVLVGGVTASTDLPGVTNGTQATYGGGIHDGFAARLSGDLRTLIQSTYLGGNGQESIDALAEAANGDLLVGGMTRSADLPGTTGGAQPTYEGGPGDGFVARLSGDLRAESPVTPSEPCVPSATKLCLNGGRFHVTVRWRDYAGTRGDGQAVTETDDSGLFWFFDADNLEMLVKVLDGCALNDRYWVFAAATTDVEYELTVRDAVTGESRTWQNPLGVASPAITDTGALAVCP